MKVVIISTGAGTISESTRFSDVSKGLEFALGIGLGS